MPTIMMARWVKYSSHKHIVQLNTLVTNMQGEYNFLVTNSKGWYNTLAINRQGRFHALVQKQAGWV